MPANEIQADWAAQRIKNLSLGKAVANAIMPKGRNSTGVTSLIEQFQYPKYGPGMMWEACAKQIQIRGQRLRLNTTVTAICRSAKGQVVAVTRNGREFQGDHLISSMPINRLVQILEPPAPETVLAAAKRLWHRDFLTVALVVEYFVSQGDDLWQADDQDLIKIATRELESLGLVRPGAVEAGYVMRVPKAYPVYDAGYDDAVTMIRDYLAHEWPTIHPVGRNGMHRYNNQDHAMLTVMVAADNLVTGGTADVWQVNVEAEYHEDSKVAPGTGTGRSAPTVSPLLREPR